MSKSRALRALVAERLTAAAEEIFALFERTLAEYGEELRRTEQQHLEQQHLWENHSGAGEHPWENHSGTGEQPWENQSTESTQTWNQSGAGLSSSLSGVEPGRVKEEPEEPLGAACVKTEEPSPLQHRQTEHRQSAQAEDLISEPRFPSAAAGHDGDAWEPFSCSSAQIHTADSGVQLQRVKQEPEEPSLLQHRQTEHRQDPQGHCSHGDSDEHREPLVRSSAQRLHPAPFPEPRSLAESAASVRSGNAKKHQCPLCLKAFGSKSNLQRHGVVHTGEKPFSCSVCNKRLNSKSYLIVHMRSHTGERPYACPFCGRSFSHKSAFNFHVQTHSKERPFSCAVCAKSFTVEYYLKVHMKTHSRDRPCS